MEGVSAWALYDGLKDQRGMTVAPRGAGPLKDSARNRNAPQIEMHNFLPSHPDLEVILGGPDARQATRVR